MGPHKSALSCEIPEKEFRTGAERAKKPKEVYKAGDLWWIQRNNHMTLHAFTYFTIKFDNPYRPESWFLKR